MRIFIAITIIFLFFSGAVFAVDTQPPEPTLEERIRADVPFLRNVIVQIDGGGELSYRLMRAIDLTLDQTSPVNDWHFSPQDLYMIMQRILVMYGPESIMLRAFSSSLAEIESPSKVFCILANARYFFGFLGRGHLFSRSIQEAARMECGEILALVQSLFQYRFLQTEWIQVSEEKYLLIDSIFLLFNFFPAFHYPYGG